MAEEKKQIFDVFDGNGNLVRSYETGLHEDPKKLAEMFAEKNSTKDFKWTVELRGSKNAGAAVAKKEEKAQEEAESYFDLTLEELIKECEARKLSTKGKKADLVARLEANDKEEEAKKTEGGK